MAELQRGPDTYFGEAGAFWAFAGDGEGAEDQPEAPSQAFFSREFSGFLSKSQEMPDLWALSSAASVGGMAPRPEGASQQLISLRPTTSSSPSPQELAVLPTTSSSWEPSSHTSNQASLPTAPAPGFFTSPCSSYPGISPLPTLSLSDSYEMQLQAQRMFPQGPGLATAPATAALPNWGGSTPSMGFKPLVEAQPQPQTLQPQPQATQPQSKASNRKSTGGGAAKGRAGGSSAAAAPVTKLGRKPASGMDTNAGSDGTKRVRGGDINKDKVLELEALLQEKASELAQLAIENRSLKVKYKVLDRMVMMQGENLNSLKSTEPALKPRNSSGSQHPALDMLLNPDSCPPLGPSNSIEEISSGGSSKSDSIQSITPISGDTRDIAVAGTTASTSFDFDFPRSSALPRNKNDPARPVPGLHSELLSLWRYHYGGKPMTVEERQLFEAMGPVQLTEKWKLYLGEVSVHLLAVETDTADDEAVEALMSLAHAAVYMFKNTALFNCETLNFMMMKDLETGETGEPEADHWGKVVNILRFSAAQRQEICAIYKIYSRVMVRVLQERQAINALMQQGTNSEHMSAFSHDQRHVGVDCEVMTKLNKSLAREVTAWRLLCGCFYGSIMTAVQYVKLGVHSWPWFPSAVAIVELVATQEGAGVVTSVAQSSSLN